MSVTTSQPGSSERSPLLSNGKSTQSISNYDAARGPVLQVESRPERGTETGSSSLQDDADDDDEEAVPDMTPEQRRKSLYRWLGFWFLVAVIVGLLVWQAFNRGGGEFDWKGALKKAGGGVSHRTSSGRFPGVLTISVRWTCRALQEHWP